MALKIILVKVGLSGISLVLDVKKETLLDWLSRAANKAEEINKALLKDLEPITRQYTHLQIF